MSVPQLAVSSSSSARARTLRSVARGCWALLFVALPFVLVLSWTAVLPAQPAPRGESAEEQARRSLELTRGIMSPFCPGRTLDGCSSGQAAVWRDDIRRWVAEGKSSSEIKQLLAERTEHDLTGAPSTALDRVLPILVTILAVLLLVLLLRALVRPSGDTQPKPKATRDAAKPETASKGADETTPKGADETTPKGADETSPKGVVARTPRDYEKRLDDELDGLDD